MPRVTCPLPRVFLYHKQPTADPQAISGGKSAAFRADAAETGVCGDGAGRSDALGSLGFDPGFRIDYDESFLLQNPWIEELKALPLRRSFSSQFEPDDFELSPYYNEWGPPAPAT